MPPAARTKVGSTSSRRMPLALVGPWVLLALAARHALVASAVAQPCLTVTSGGRADIVSNQRFDRWGSIVVRAVNSSRLKVNATMTSAGAGFRSLAENLKVQLLTSLPTVCPDAVGSFSAKATISCSSAWGAVGFDVPSSAFSCVAGVAVQPRVVYLWVHLDGTTQVRVLHCTRARGAAWRHCRHWRQ